MSPHSPSPGSGQRYQASILRRAKRDPGEQRAGQALGLIVSLLAIVVLTAFLSMCCSLDLDFSSTLEAEEHKLNWPFMYSSKILGGQVVEEVTLCHLE